MQAVDTTDVLPPLFRQVKPQRQVLCRQKQMSFHLHLPSPDLPLPKKQHRFFRAVRLPESPELVQALPLPEASPLISAAPYSMHAWWRFCECNLARRRLRDRWSAFPPSIYFCRSRRHKHVPPGFPLFLHRGRQFR